MRIIHVFRAPIGGLFRHVIDLAKEQAARGHDVGVFCDATFAGERNEKLLAELARHLALGVCRVPMHRNPHWSDLRALAGLARFRRETRAEVLHGHGSKGGLYARLDASLARRGPLRAYTPHGGSLNYRPRTVLHRAYMIVERLLERGTDAFLFESRFIADRYLEYVCGTDAVSRIVLNGLYSHELNAVFGASAQYDFLYIGEFRFAKGIDTLVDAMAMVRSPGGSRPTLLLVGQGPDEDALKAQCARLGLTDSVFFRKPMAAREAFELARVMVVPSRFESMPYVVIEAAGASMPLISTDVGGIPEIFGAESGRLIPCDDVPTLVAAMTGMIEKSDAERKAEAARLAAHIRADFCVVKMATTVLDAYRAAELRRPEPFSGPARAPAE
jgi:glycosyltransferase involved in cell wall biosynthesis